MASLRNQGIANVTLPVTACLAGSMIDTVPPI